jgi:hypothetical protein
MRALLVGLLVLPGAASAQKQDVQMSPISGDPENPRRHYRVRNPASLSGAEAERIYRIALPSLTLGYRGSGNPHARAYPQWRRHNRVPYLSRTHGNHYLSNYTNELADKYSLAEEAPVMPPGAVIAKDSFSMTPSGEILLGPLFLMEKMQPDFSPVSGDWRYTMVRPDGRVLGTTGGKGSERVSYCITCHLAREANDHLYFVPRKAR